MASAQVFLVTIPCSFDIYRCICISALSHNLLCPTAYFIWILKHKLKLGTHSIRGNLTKLLTQFVYEVFPCGDNITKNQTYFQICTSSSANGKHIFTRYLLYFDSDGLFFEILGSNNIYSCLLINMGGGQVGCRADRQVGKWGDGHVGWSTGGQVHRWAGGQADTLIITTP